ncbi:MAG: hypothetical protein HPY50_03845 [Firmicutes bacterium]|nr:hypothetical protein [Bacillota bacterium]
MSRINVAGIIFHCTQCGKTHKVEFEGGASLTQIGESGIFRQVELSQKYAPSDMRDFYTKPSYLRDEIVCSDCYNDKYKSEMQETFNADVQELISLADKMDTLKEDYLSQLNKNIEEITTKWLNAASLDSFKEISTDVFIETLGHRHLKYPARRYKLIDQFMNESGLEVIDYARKLIMDSPEVRDMQEKFHNSFMPLLDKSEKILTFLENSSSTANIYFFIEEKIDQARNLNDFIRYEKTIREPKKSTPDLTVFRKYGLNIKEVRDSFLDIPQPGSLLKEDRLIKEVKAKITALADSIF